MKSYSLNHPFSITLLSFLLLIIGYVLLAPTQLGGAVTYVIVDGNSMEPNFHFGDLVLLRTQPSYQLGDAVTYQNAELGRYVFHRIVSMNLDRFVLQGDHNTWLDTYHPSQDEVVGKLWVHIPKLGKVIEWVRLPLHMGLTVALLGGILMSDMFIKPTKQEKKKNGRLGSFDGVPQGALYIAGFLSLAFLALTIFSFSRPLTRSAENTPFQQDGNFFYSATGTPGVYDTALVRPGEPIFPKLTCFMNVGFTYNLTSNGVQGITGSNQMYARILDEQSGWQRTIPMSQPTTFNGNSYFANSTLDLCQVQSLVTLVEQETGLHPSTYTLEIVTHVEFSGNIAGNQVNDVFDPSLSFKFDKAHFYLAPSGTQTDPLHSSKQGMVTGSLTPQVNTFSVAGFNLDVRIIRVIALLGLGFTLLSLVLIGIHIYNTTQENPDARIRLKYGGMLVDVNESNLESTSSTVAVASMEDLAKLAERHGTMILHLRMDLSDHYLIQNNSVTYRYITGTDNNRVTPPLPLENKPVESRKSHRANPMTLSSQNKAMRQLASNRSAVTPKIEPVEKISNTLPMPMELEPTQEIEPAIVEQKSIWEVLQEKIESPVLAMNNSKANGELFQRKEPEYVIQSGMIEFFSSEPVETVMLSRVKI